MNEVLKVLLVLFEGFVLWSYIDLNFDLQKGKKKYQVFWCVMAVTLVATLFQAYSFYKLLCINVGIMIVSKLFYKGTLINIMMRIALYYMVLVAIETGTMFIVIEIIGSSLFEVKSLHPIEFTMMGYVCTSIVFVVTRVIGKNNPEKKKVRAGYWSMIILSNVCTTVLIMFMMTLREQQPINQILMVISMLACISLAILNVFHFYTYIALKEEYQKENEYALIKQASDGQFKYIMENERAFKIVRKSKHDLSNQLIGLKLLLQENRTEEAKAYIQQLSEKLEDAELRYMTGYPIIDAVINQKYELCKAYHIDMNCEIGKLAEVELNAQDVCVVLGNALDNAIEANLLVPEGKRKLVVRIYCKKGYVICQINNAYRPSSDHHKLETTKDKEWHGIGLKSIREVVKAYDGEVHIQMDEEIFQLKVVVPLSEKTYKKSS